MGCVVSKIKNYSFKVKKIHYTRRNTLIIISKQLTY